MAELKKIRPKGRDAECMKFTGEQASAEAIDAWMRSHNSGVTWLGTTWIERLYFHRGPQLLVVNIGNWVVRDYTGFFRITDYDLEQLYDFI